VWSLGTQNASILVLSRSCREGWKIGGPLLIRRGVLAVVFVVVFAAVAISIILTNPTLHGAKKAYVVIVLALCAAIPVIKGIAGWLGNRNPDRCNEARAAAQISLRRLIQSHRRHGGVVALELKIHVWQVPLAYRRTFSYSRRDQFKKAVRKHRHLKGISEKLAIRPALERVAVVGLRDPSSSNVTFRKRVGLVGCCIEENTKEWVHKLDATSHEYREALDLDEDAWDGNPTVSRGLALSDAKLLARYYGKVIAAVVQSDEGEAIGCVTMSTNPNVREFDIMADHAFGDELLYLSSSLKGPLKTRHD